MLSTASLRNPVGITKPSSLLLFVQQDKNFLEESAKVKETYFSGKKSMKEVHSEFKLASKPTVVYIA